MTHPGRNDLCPCGSGKKYKRCCGSEGSQQREKPAAVGQQLKPAVFEEARRLYEAGNRLAEQGLMERAAEQYALSLSLRADAQAHNNLGNALAAQGKAAEAVVQYQHALALNPNHAEAHCNLALVLTGQNKMEQAAPHYERAIALNPEFAEAHNNLGLVLTAQGKISQALAHYKRALQIRPDYVDANSNMLFALNYVFNGDPGSIYNMHLDFAKRYEPQFFASIQKHANSLPFERRIKVGYVSSDFRRHSVAWFIEPVLENHDHNRFEIVCYSNNTQEDEVTERLKTLADQWCDIARMSDDAIAKQIRDDQIDILVDLNGHTALNRLLAFCRKPAPIQVAWLGYPSTTGLSVMDYRITDGFADPVGMTEHLHSEALVRLPECFSCYKPSENAPEVSELPAQANGYVTFGSFNHQAKISPELISIWAKILQAVPTSRLVLKNFGLGANTTQRYVRELFANAGIGANRLELLGHDAVQTSHLERYRTIDIGLDTFPYNGATTSCEALWMGVPVITLAGVTHAGRVGVSQLSNLGLPELIASTPEAYIETAIKLANDLDHLSRLRKASRSRMAASPLCDAPRFTRHLEDAYRGMWARYVEGMGDGNRKGLG